MRATAIVAALLMFLMMTACGDPKPPARDPGAYNDGSGTVYDDQRDGDGYDEVQDVSEDPGYDEPISSEPLDDPVVKEMEQPLDLNWAPIFFAFDQAELSTDSKATLAAYAEVLVNNPKLYVLLEGHCDTRGTEDYNLALGERRAQNVSLYLQSLGVPRNRLRTISYGELRPIDPIESESAWSKNRRVSFTF